MVHNELANYFAVTRGGRMLDEGYGYGSVHQRSSDGRWLAVLDLPRGRGERRRRKTFSAPTRELAVARLDAYRADHPATSYPGRAAYDARARAQGTHSRGEWFALVRAVGRICHYCGVDASMALEKDHAIPVSRGGSDAIENLVVACRDCNAEKGTMTADEYMAWKSA